jgi:hypothetical protein
MRQEVNMKSNMIINVGFLAGTDVDSAVKEAKDKAALWGVAYVCFNLNGTKFTIGANADLCEVMEQWKDQDTKYGICSA